MAKQRRVPYNHRKHKRHAKQGKGIKLYMLKYKNVFYAHIFITQPKTFEKEFQEMKMHTREKKI